MKLNITDLLEYLNLLDQELDRRIEELEREGDLKILDEYRRQSAVQQLDIDDTLTLHECGQLGAMLRWQNQLTTFLNRGDATEELIPHIVQCLVVETSEVLAHFLNKTKVWKSTDVNWDEVDEEMIDVLHFFLTYFNLRGIDGDGIVERYRQKNLKNLDRAYTAFNG